MLAGCRRSAKPDCVSSRAGSTACWHLLEARTGDRSGATVLLSGAPGVGKSTSADALLRGLAGRVRRAFRVTADEPSRRQPFGLITALVGLVPEYPPLPDLGDRVLGCGRGDVRRRPVGAVRRGSAPRRR